MATDTAVADPGQVEHVDMLIGGDGQSDWEKMTPQQREVDVDKAVAKVASRGQEESEPPSTDIKEPTVPGDVTPAEGDAALSADRQATAAKAVEGEGEEAAPEEPDWRDQETRDFASMMGLDDDFLAAIPSREVLDRVLQAIDKKAFEAGKAAEKPPAEPAKAVAQQSEKPPTTEGDPLADLSQYHLKTTEEGGEFDPEAAKPFNTFIEKAATEIRGLRNEVAALKHHQQRQAAGDIRQRALASLHSLGNTELFGKPDEKPTKEQAANIEKALDAHLVHARGLLAQKRGVAPTPAFLKAAVNLAFGDQLRKQEKAADLAKLRKQSGRRTGGGVGKLLPKEPPEGETSQERARRIAADPEVQAIFNKFATENAG